jgi:hypothetical protein
MMEQEALASNMKNPTSKKINKSTKYYLICGGAAVLLIVSLLLMYAWLTHVDILAWFSTKYAFIMYGAILIYLTIGVILIVKDKIRSM